MMMRPLSIAALVLACVSAAAQTHVVKKTESVVRAVGVYEWTGEEGKATASRLVPVSVYINSRLEDAGVYLARPVPFALDVGTVFAVRKAGVDEGTLEIAYARHRVTTGNGAFDDGWLAVGPLKLTPTAPAVATLKAGPVGKIEVGTDKGPHFGAKTAPSPDSTEPAKPEKPVDHSTAAGSSTTVAAQDDSEHPTLHRAPQDKTDAKTVDSSADDVDRPTLKKRRTAEQTHADAKIKNQASVTGTGTSLNDDPDRPTLHRGKPASRMEETDLPPLAGVPKDMHQRVAVSDAKDPPEHDFSRPWESAAERADVMAHAEELARAEFMRYGGVSMPVPAAPKATPAKAGVAARRPQPTKKAATPSMTLTEETLNGYTLSYGGAATYVYAAQAAGAEGAPRYITLVLQRDPLGTLKVAMTNVTDAAHLDRTPWLRLVDVVDADASNRASLLFELRAQTTRQFALYRVIGAQAEQMFVTAAAQ